MCRDWTRDWAQLRAVAFVCYWTGVAHTLMPLLCSHQHHPSLITVAGGCPVVEKHRAYKVMAQPEPILLSPFGDQGQGPDN